MLDVDHVGAEHGEQRGRDGARPPNPFRRGVRRSLWHGACRARGVYCGCDRHDRE